jgi:hypothetical protein
MTSARIPSDIYVFRVVGRRVKVIGLVDGKAQLLKLGKPEFLEGLTWV